MNLHIISADIVHRLPDLTKESPDNAQQTIENIMRPFIETVLKVEKRKTLESVLGSLTGMASMDRRMIEAMLKSD